MPEGDDRERWGERRQPDQGTLDRTLGRLETKIDNIDRGFVDFRRDVQEGRIEFRAEMLKQLQELRESKVDIVRYRVIETVVLGFVGIILVTVAYALIEGRPMLLGDKPAIGDHK